MTWHNVMDLTSTVGRTSAFALCLLTALGTTQMASAQTEKTVTLKYDDGDGVTGDIISFENGIFRLSSLFGDITVPADSVICIGAACPEGTTPVEPLIPVTLVAKDGSTKITGGLLEIKDEKYVIATDVGEFSVSVADVNCTGEACVATKEPVPAFGGPVVLSGMGNDIEGILVDLSDEAYIVDVPNLGRVQINKASFLCAGEGCPPE